MLILAAMSQLSQMSALLSQLSQEDFKNYILVWKGCIIGGIALRVYHVVKW